MATDSHTNQSPEEVQHAADAEHLASEAIDSIDEGFVIYDRGLRVQVWNRVNEALTGVPRERALGKHLYDVFPTLRALDVEPLLQRALNGETVVAPEPWPRIRGTTEYLSPTADLKVLQGPHIAWTLSTFRPHKNAHGEITGVVVTLVDLTERRRAEDAAFDSGKRLSAVLDNVVDGVVTINSQGVIESFNRSAEHIFGYHADEVIGRNVAILMPEPYRSGHDGYIRNYIETGVAKIIGIGREVEGRRKDGSTFPLDLAVSELYLGGERRFIGMLRDITDRKRAQESIVAAHRFNEEVMANLNEGIIVYGLDFTVRAWNRFMEKVTGLSCAEVLGKHMYEIFPTIRAHQPDLAFRRALAGETVVSSEPLGRIRGTNEFLPPGVRTDETDDSRAAWTLTTWAPLRDQAGNVQGVIVTVTDVTELQRSRDQLAASVERLRELSAHMESVREAERTRIARELHDELGGILTAVKFDLSRFAELPPTESGRIAQLIGLVDSAIKSTRRITSDLRPPAIDQLGLWSAVEWHVTEVAKRNELRCETRIAPELEDVTLRSDVAIALFRIVQEALTNVVKHAQASSVRVSATRLAEEIRVEVADDGRGIADWHLRTEGHWGLLGMSERALNHGRKVDLHSKPGRGTTVYLTMPIA